MKLTEAQFNKLLARLGELPAIPCEICKGIPFVVSNTVLEMGPFRPGVRAAGTVYPVIGTFCNTCGHARFFSAIALGVVAADGGPVDG